ncbi:TetR/AcrR family transcriptional regulator [Nocardia sp. NPDC127606]|uniref:TetR/AcrR family transcriptional regulator n=1 Tax=Nocardia sp. NPDC127606 TaxID=3345406 RepID=UPI00363FC8FA
MTDRKNRPYASRMAPEERREQLLDAVLDVIVEQGVHKVSIDTVAKRAGVSRPVVYSQFSDSDQLLRASLEREEAAVAAQMSAVVPQAQPTERADRAMVQSLDNFLSAVLAAPQRWRAVFQLADSSTPAFRRRVERGRNALIAAFTTFVQTATPATQQGSVDAELTGRLMSAVFWEAGRIVLAEPEAFPPQRIHDCAQTFIPALPAFHDRTRT